MNNHSCSKNTKVLKKALKKALKKLSLNNSKTIKQFFYTKNKIYI
jgi:hypothetical protein